MAEKQLVYFLCTGNSCRSQMAHGFLEHYGSDRYLVESAGLEAHGLNPRAIEVMDDAGVDISNHTSDIIAGETLKKADFIITLCGHADEHCPVVATEAVRWHWGFEDPAKATGTEDEIMDAFRDVRDQIKQRIEEFLTTGR